MASAHTRRYLNAILVPAIPTTSSAAAKGPKSTTSEGNDGISGKDSSRTPSTSSTHSDSDDNEDSEGANSASSDNASTSEPDNAGVTAARAAMAAKLDTEERTRKVIDVLNDANVSEEDKPDRLKDALRQVVEGTEAGSLDIDAIVLAILHRHREDLNPTGQTFHSPAPRQSLSRSNSFRRTLTPTSATTLAMKRAGITTPTRPLSPSPLRGASRDEQHHMGHYLSESSASSIANSSAPSSPFGSPRMLSASAISFKPNVSALEFRPLTPTLPALAAANSAAQHPHPQTPQLVVNLPEQKLSRSAHGTPLGTPIEPSPTLWAFNASPLGTPKFATGGVASPSLAQPHNGSYFPTVGSSRPSTSSSHPAPPAIPSDPWNNLSDSSVNSAGSVPGISNSSSTASSESSYDDVQYDPFKSSPRAANRKSPTTAEEGDEEDDLDEFGMPTTSHGEGRRLADLTSDAARQAMFQDDEEEDFQLLNFKGGQLLPEETDLIEPSLQRPVFEEGHFPQSTAQYSQLPEFLPPPHLAGPPGSLNMPPPGMTPNSSRPGTPGVYSPGLGAPGAPGLGNSSNYIMTPFDVLCSIFAGSDVSPAALEEALSRNGWDVDRSMEWIINNPNLPGLPGSAPGEQVDNLHMHSLDLNDPRHTPPHRHPRAPPIGSGSRPNVVPREQFQRIHSSGGRPGSPRWAGMGEGGSRPGTPRSSGPGGDGYFGGPGGMPQGGPSTRLCKYFLQGNCLRSDCRFSHDLSKAVCKFWLRGHCLKGEGRCEFLHSVPPHLAQDVAQLRINALRDRDRERARRGAGGYDDDGLDHGSMATAGRVEEDFPTLAAATQSRNAAAAGAPKDPAASRWAGIVKNGRSPSANPVPVNNRPSLPRSASQTSVGGRGQRDERHAPFSQPRQSARISLRPPTLLPTIDTGASVNKLYEQYRANFIQLGNSRNKCLVKAAQCWKQNDPAGAKHWSREAQEWNRQVGIEGAEAAQNIVSERRKALREAVMSSSGRPGQADPSSDRQYRGEIVGAGYGVCLGVAAAGEALGPEGVRLTASERTEVALDMHGLHADEAMEILESFLLAIARENVMRGLAYVIVGNERHTGTADVQRGARKLRLADAVGGFLDEYGYSFWLSNGIYIIDPYL